MLAVSQSFLLFSTSLHNSHGWNWSQYKGVDISAVCFPFGPLDFDSEGISAGSGLN
jgi:hypothetical protein